MAVSNRKGKRSRGAGGAGLVPRCPRQRTDCRFDLSARQSEMFPPPACITDPDWEATPATGRVL